MRRSGCPRAAGTRPCCSPTASAGRRTRSRAQAADLQARGYVVVTWTARGFGASGGRIHLDDPAFEVADAQNARRPGGRPRRRGSRTAPATRASASWVAPTAGRLSLMLAAADPRVDGVVAAVTWNDLADAFFPQAAVTGPSATPAGRAPSATPGPFKQVWASNFFLGSLGARAGPPPPQPSGQSAPVVPRVALRSPPVASSCGRFDPILCALFVDASRSGHAQRRAAGAAPRAQPEADAGQGHGTDLPHPGHGRLPLRARPGRRHRARARRGRGAPRGALDRRGPRRAELARGARSSEAAYAWLDHYVANHARGRIRPARRRIRLPDGPAAPQPDRHALVRSRLPGSARHDDSDDDGAPRPTVPPRRLVRPPGGQPAGMIAIPGAASLGVPLATYAIAALPGQSLAIDSEPVTGGHHRRRVADASPWRSPRARPTVTLFASLWRVTGDQPALPHALVAPLRVPVTPGAPRRSRSRCRRPPTSCLRAVGGGFSSRRPRRASPTTGIRPR